MSFSYRADVQDQAQVACRLTVLSLAIVGRGKGSIVVVTSRGRRLSCVTVHGNHDQSQVKFTGLIVRRESSHAKKKVCRDVWEKELFDLLQLQKFYDNAMSIEAAKIRRRSTGVTFLPSNGNHQATHRVPRRKSGARMPCVRTNLYVETYFLAQRFFPLDIKWMKREVLSSYDSPRRDACGVELLLDFVQFVETGPGRVLRPGTLPVVCGKSKARENAPCNVIACLKWGW
ncbi:hypothetical protein Tco_1112346 [Tanacetum coccineum]|uniref:Uncharacterized protein n=1 Tax=Tanacetum coccineum TaxID=301880 RepID=A0ABQ5IRV0_9ASTR